MTLTDLSISEAATLIETRQLSPVELTQAYLDRIERLNPILNAFITVTTDHALKAARMAEAEIKDGAYRGPLHGIPFAYKDLFETKGVLTSAGSKHFANYVPARDGTVIARLSEAGAVMLGKLNMHELAFGVTTDNTWYGTCKNPYDLHRIPGGSSGGSGAALAARLCAGALGSDTRGSIRIPAAACGVVGLKPTYGRNSLHGVIPLSWNLDHVGPMARRVRDVALMLGFMVGYDPADPFSVDYPVGDYLDDLEAGIEGWRIAIADDEFFTPADSELSVMLTESAKIFTSLGAQVYWVDASWLRASGDYSRIMLGADAAAFHRERYETRPDDFSGEIRKRLERDSAYTSRDYAEARYAQNLAIYQIGTFFENYDLLVTPTTPAPALRHDQLPEWRKSGGDYTRFSAPFNMTGVPAVSIPGGFSEAGLPLGLQIVAPHWGEAQLLRAAYAYEQAAGWYQRTPEL